MTEKKQESKNNSNYFLLKSLIYATYFVSIILLCIVVLAIVSNRKTDPFYSWIENTSFESLGIFVAGLIVEQKVNMQISEVNSPLSHEEEKVFSELLEKHNDKSNKLHLTTLEPRDKRFIIEHPWLRPIHTGNYLVLTNSDSEEIHKFAGILDDLYATFINEMQGADFAVMEHRKPHICYLKNRADYLKVSKEANKHFHDSLGFFSPIKNCIYLFSRKSSLEGLEVEEKFSKAINFGNKKYDGQELDLFLDTIKLNKARYLAKLDEETICTLRHEGTHQLSYMLGLHSLRGFEKRWLTEGIAQYFETIKPGKVREAKRKMLRDHLSEGRLHSWQDLINYDEVTFKSSETYGRQLAYSQSWLLVKYLMEKHRNTFFDYIKLTREKGVLDSPLKNTDFLCKLLGTSMNKLTAELNEKIENL